MNIKSQFFLDLCFIWDNAPTNRTFVDAVEEQLEDLFSGKGYWYIEGKREGDLDIVVAEIKGITIWQKEEDVLHYLEVAAEPQFWEWMKGYRIQIAAYDKAECSHCGKG